jgi:hypothetical protein
MEFRSPDVLLPFGRTESKSAYDVALHCEHEDRRRQNIGQKACRHKPELDPLGMLDSCEVTCSAVLGGAPGSC